MKKYTDVFAWSYEDLKKYDTSIIQHTIPIKPGVEAWKFTGNNSKGFSPVNVPN